MKKIFLMAVVVGAMMVANASAGLIAIDFDESTKWTNGSGGITSYQTDHTYVDQGFTFTGGPALRNGTSNQDGFASALGTCSWRLRDSGAVVWTATYTNVTSPLSIVESFGFDVRRWDGSPSPNFQVSYSLDKGVTFSAPVATIDNAFLGNSSDWKTDFNFILPVAALVSDNQFIVRVAAAADSTERIMIDNFRASAVPEPTAFILVGSLVGLAGLTRRRR